MKECLFFWFEVFDADMRPVGTSNDKETAMLMCPSGGLVFACSKKVGRNADGLRTVEISMVEIRSRLFSSSVAACLCGRRRAIQF